MAAYRCAFDQAELAAVEATPGVLQCPKCGYRTDTPGSGALADGFDVLHRQWGTRGDPHVWQAIRERIGATPTPDADDAVRHAYVDALREVTGVDVDASQEPSIYLETYNFGGMGGGHVSLEWWRTKGIPLLTERATARRPAIRQPAATPAGLLMSILVWVLVMAIPAGLIGGGAFLLYQRAVGTRTTATVIECTRSGGMVSGAPAYRGGCTATWTVDGVPTIGAYTGGGGESDVGKTVDVTVRGDTAYRRELGMPILLIALGAPFLVLPVAAWRTRRR